MRDDNIISIFDVLLTETTLVTKANPGLGRNWDRYRRGPSFGRILDWSKRGPPHRLDVPTPMLSESVYREIFRKARAITADFDHPLHIYVHVLLFKCKRARDNRLAPAAIRLLSQ